MKYTIEQILAMLYTEQFAEFYSDDGMFGKHVTGEEDTSKLEIKIEIERMLGKVW